MFATTKEAPDMGAKTSTYLSSNVLFSGAVEGEDPNLPPGESIAQKIEAALRDRSWDIVEPADLGDYSLWCLVCRQGAAELRVQVAGTRDENVWLLQVAPSRRPGFVGRLRRQLPSATSSDVLSLSREIHEMLFVVGAFSDPKWCWDGLPQEMIAYPEPPDCPAT
jgi:hypothetical protein